MSVLVIFESKNYYILVGGGGGGGDIVKWCKVRKPLPLCFCAASVVWSQVAVPFNRPQWRLTDADKQILHKEVGEEEEKEEEEEEEEEYSGK